MPNAAVGAGGRRPAMVAGYYLLSEAFFRGGLVLGMLRFRVRFALGPGCMPAFAEFFHDFPVELRNIGRLAARNQALVHHHLLVDPLGAGIAEVGFH